MAAAKRTIGVFGFEDETRKVTTTYFLMEFEKALEPYEDYREPAWFTIDQAGHPDLPVPDDVIKVLQHASDALDIERSGRQADGLVGTQSEDEGHLRE